MRTFHILMYFAISFDYCFLFFTIHLFYPSFMVSKRKKIVLLLNYCDVFTEFLCANTKAKQLKIPIFLFIFFSVFFKLMRTHNFVYLLFRCFTYQMLNVNSRKNDEIQSAQTKKKNSKFFSVFFSLFLTVSTVFSRSDAFPCSDDMEEMNKLNHFRRMTMV